MGLNRKNPERGGGGEKKLEKGSAMGGSRGGQKKSESEREREQLKALVGLLL